ncbi:kinase [Nocardia nova]|uniref:Kinase n=1 Tax=Nocardia nova TaxID=37330 RepID=A0A2S6AXN3_9NOCA|nr:kinase [Nocardia nova]PPJ39968.1 kinase [Nocardia nova]
MTVGVILYGPPAAGKDTVTTALTDEDGRFRLFERLKSGQGRTAGYRMTSEEHLESLARAGEIVWENSRYGARYVIDRPGLQELVASGRIPVVHAGQPEVIPAVRAAVPGTWIVVQLSTSREVARQRILERATGDTAARLAAWDATPRLLSSNLDIDTGRTSPEQAARLIRSLIGR